MATAKKHRAERQSARMSKITNDGGLNLDWHRMLYSCTHMATVGVIGLIQRYAAYCFLYTIYTTFRPILYHYPSTQLKLVSSFICIVLFYVSYVVDVLQWLLFTVLLFCRSYSYMDCLFSFYARPYVFTFYVTFTPVTVCECHTELKATWLDLTCLRFWYA